jgi:hypothetical protein
MLHRCLNGILLFLLDKLERQTEAPFDSLPVREKTIWIRKLLEELDEPPSTKQFLIGLLLQCDWVDQERERVVSECRIQHTCNWLFPLGETADCLQAIRYRLEETLSWDNVTLTTPQGEADESLQE